MSKKLSDDCCCVTHHVLVLVNVATVMVIRMSNYLNKLYTFNKILSIFNLLQNSRKVDNSVDMHKVFMSVHFFFPFFFFLLCICSTLNWRQARCRVMAARRCRISSSLMFLTLL